MTSDYHCRMGRAHLFGAFALLNLLIVLCVLALHVPDWRPLLVMAAILIAIGLLSCFARMIKHFRASFRELAFETRHSRNITLGQYRPSSKSNF